MCVYICIVSCSENCFHIQHFLMYFLSVCLSWNIIYINIFVYIYIFHTENCLYAYIQLEKALFAHTCIYRARTCELLADVHNSLNACIYIDLCLERDESSLHTSLPEIYIYLFIHTHRYICIYRERVVLTHMLFPFYKHTHTSMHIY